MSQEELIGWAIKKLDSDKPPTLFEEAILMFQVNGNGTNQWVIACIERSLARGNTNRTNWRPSRASRAMSWSWFKSQKPKDKDLVAFVGQSNFAHNEFNPDLLPIYVAIYEPHGSLVKAVKKGIAASEKESRLRDSDDIIWDPK